jgi:ADP-heptose:LPS heptosyltransferase
MSLPETHRNGFVGFAIGAQHFTKRLPVEKLIEACHFLNRPVILLGGKEDFETGEHIRLHFEKLPETNQNKPAIYNACGQYNLNQSASLVKQADLIVSHDTGLMHIAAAFKKKIISIWGNTVPEFGMYPYKTDFEVLEVKGLKCRPCSKIGYGKCPQGHFKCMRQQNLAVLGCL